MLQCDCCMLMFCLLGFLIVLVRWLDDFVSGFCLCLCI